MTDEDFDAKYGRRFLIVSWDDETNTALLDTRGLSSFDVYGLLRGALKRAKEEIPMFSFLEPEDESEESGDEDAGAEETEEDE